MHWDRDDANARRFWTGALWVAACAGCYFGWKTYWFLTDDAFIAFRYIGNRQLGHGYTWNAPPFLPVEGYSSFLWVVLLDAIWSALGVPPPGSANNVSLICALSSLAIVALWVRSRWAEVARGSALPWLLFWTLALIVTNRTFLVWASSGLETALFNALVLLWCYLLFGLTEAPRARAPLVAALASLLCLARPDGLLFWSVTVGLLAGLALLRAVPGRALIASVVLLLGAPAHVAWRYAYYGSWLPNTYYAKVVAAWPEVGIRYLASFVLEYGLWLWLAVIALAALRAVRARVWWRVPAPALLARVAASFAVLAHVAYYVLVVGGDHFEYRVLSQLVPLLALAFVRSAVLIVGVRFAGLLCAALLAVQSVIPWTHFALTRDLYTRRETLRLKVAVAPALAPPFAALAVPFDRLQAELIDHGVGVRHQEHKVFRLWQQSMYPSRARGLALRMRQPNPVHVYPCVGVGGWTLPRVHVIDTLGLNDHVIARTPVERSGRGAIGHERKPPPGYLESFAPNVQFGREHRLIELARRQPLTDERIRAIERRYRAIVDAR